jgi:hypothetical protein
MSICLLLISTSSDLHSALDGDIPATLPDLADVDNMPGRWCKLLSIAQDFIASNQSAFSS